MTKFHIVSDERMQVVSGRIAFIFLGLTQTAILFAILRRRYFMGQGEEFYSDFRLILASSVFGYIAARLYYGAILPILLFRKLLYIYAGFVSFLFVGLSVWFAMPTLDKSTNTILPVLLGPVILLCLYWLFAYLGKKRMDKFNS